jgi:Rho GTPase-activating protein RGD1
MQALLMQYARFYEEGLIAEASLISPISADGVSLKEALGKIDPVKDFEESVGTFLSVTPRVQLKQEQTGPVAPARSAKSRLFGVPLDLVLQREDTDCPALIQGCFELIETRGVDTPALYRTPVSADKLHQYKAILEADGRQLSTLADDMPLVTSIVKAYLTDLPEPLLTKALFDGFVKAARLDQPKRRLIGTHEMVNQLPDSSYLMLKQVMRHLQLVSRHHKINHMDSAHLGMVFGPILLSGVDLSGDSRIDPSSLRDLDYQCTAVETILLGVDSIFDQ